MEKGCKKREGKGEGEEKEGAQEFFGNTKHSTLVQLFLSAVRISALEESVSENKI